MKRLFLLCNILFVLIACGRVSTSQKLDQIGRILVSFPDSAERALSQISRKQLVSIKQLAHYSLLSLELGEIQGRRIIDDSLVQEVSKYYANHGPKSIQMRVCYFQGKSYYEKGDWQSALACFYTAETIAIQLEEASFRLRCRQEILRVLNSLYDYDGEIRVFEERSLPFLPTFIQNVSIMEESLSQPIIDTTESSLFHLVFERVLLSERREQEDLFPKKTAAEWAREGYSNLHSGNVDLAEFAFGQAEQAVRTFEEHYLVSSYRHLSSLFLRDTIEAYKALSSMFASLKENQNQHTLESSLKFESDFFHEQAIAAYHHLASSRRRLTIVVFVSILLALLLCVAILFSYSKKKLFENRINRALLAVREVERNLSDSLRFGLVPFEELMYLYSTGQKNKIVEKTGFIVNRFSDDTDFQSKLISSMNTAFSGAISLLKESVPNIKHSYIFLYALLLGQFSHLALSVFLKTTEAGVNSKIYRLRKKITESESSNKERLLSLIDRHYS